jgi:hypothetical protein
MRILNKLLSGNRAWVEEKLVADPRYSRAWPRANSPMFCGLVVPTAVCR